MRKPYKTKNRKAEFKQAYGEIGEINMSIQNYELEIEVFLKYGNLEEANWRQEIISDLKSRLLILSEKGYDIKYMHSQSSGLEVISTTAELF